MERVDLSIIIVSYNTKDLLLNCLGSIGSVNYDQWHVEIIVVDNASSDDSVKAVQNFRLGVPNENFNLKIIKNNQNLGFSKANNLGIRGSLGKYVLLLNSDTVVSQNTISEMLKYMEENPQIGVSTCRVELANGKLDPACHRGFPTPWASLTYFLGLEKLFPKTKIFGQYHMGYMDINKPHEIDSPTGAFYLIRKEVIDKVGLMDEDYFMYGEDLDWSFRIKKAGFKIIYYPYVKITHFKKQSGRLAQDRKLQKQMNFYFYETMKLFYKKNMENKYPKWITKLIMLSIDIRKRI